MNFNNVYYLYFSNLNIKNVYFIFFPILFNAGYNCGIVSYTVGDCIGCELTLLSLIMNTKYIK